jgi:predicted NBD/HSP70 family sugar kinase
MHHGSAGLGSKTVCDFLAETTARTEQRSTRPCGLDELEVRAPSVRSGDMHEVLAGADAGDEQCRLALDVYFRRLAAGVAGMVASMNGIDAIVFTGGVG